MNSNKQLTSAVLGGKYSKDQATSPFSRDLFNLCEIFISKIRICFSNHLVLLVHDLLRGNDIL